MDNIYSSLVYILDIGLFGIWFFSAKGFELIIYFFIVLVSLQLCEGVTLPYFPFLCYKICDFIGDKEELILKVANTPLTAPRLFPLYLCNHLSFPSLFFLPPSQNKEGHHHFVSYYTGNIIQNISSLLFFSKAGFINFVYFIIFLTHFFSMSLGSVGHVAFGLSNKLLWTRLCSSMPLCFR